MKRHDRSHKEISSAELLSLFADGKDTGRLFDEYGNTVLDAAWELFCGGNSQAASFLCISAKKKAAREYISDLADRDKRSCLHVRLSSENPKMRKNTARLMGALCCADDDEYIIRALNAEKIRMVIPSMLLSLGAIGTEKCHSALKSYTVAPAEDEQQEKHVREEQAALAKALSAFADAQRHVFIGFEEIPALKLTCARSMGKYAARDCRAVGLTVLSQTDSSVTVKGAPLDTLKSVRSFRELLIPIQKGDEPLSAAKERITDFLSHTHRKSEAPFRYRLEYRGGGDRRTEINRYLAVFDGGALINSVSSYECEIRIDSDASIKLKLFTYDDDRFSYRRSSLPASIAPANAASVMSFARDHLQKNATVLDMCCGSGTMLFERDKAAPCRKLIGVDISQKAIPSAKENAVAYGSDALFYNADLRKFTLREKVDEVISNLPFGNRVGTHEDNDQLYSDIIAKIKYDWLKVGGICVLYTMERNLLMRKLHEAGGFSVLSEVRTDAGGLYPCACLLRLDNMDK